MDSHRAALRGPRHAEARRADAVFGHTRQAVIRAFGVLECGVVKVESNNPDPTDPEQLRLMFDICS